MPAMSSWEQFLALAVPIVLLGLWAHHYAERRRRQVLTARSVASQAVVGASGAGTGDLATTLVVRALARALGVAEDAIKLEDRLDRDYKLPSPCHLIFPDEWDLMFIESLDAGLKEWGFPPWRGSTRGIVTVRDLIARVADHMQASGAQASQRQDTWG